MDDNTIKITKLPPGEAMGARDLRKWASNRRAGGSGVPLSKKQRQRIKRMKREAWRAGVVGEHETYSDYLEKVATRIIRAGRVPR